MYIICKCGEEFKAKERECPDGIEGCSVAHLDPKSFICPNCEFNTWKDIRNMKFELEEGPSIINPKAIAQLEFKLDE